MAPSFCEATGSFDYFMHFFAPQQSSTLTHESSSACHCIQQVWEFSKFLFWISLVTMVGMAIPELSWCVVAGHRTNWYFSSYFNDDYYLIRDFLFVIFYSGLAISILLLLSQTMVIRLNDKSLCKLFVIWIVLVNGLSMIYAPFRYPLFDSSAGNVLINVDVYRLIWFCTLPYLIPLLLYFTLIKYVIAHNTCLITFNSVNNDNDNDNNGSNKKVDKKENTSKTNNTSRTKFTSVTSAVTTKHKTSSHGKIAIDDENKHDTHSVSYKDPTLTDIDHNHNHNHNLSMMIS